MGKTLVIHSDITDPVLLTYAIRHADNRTMIFRGHKSDPSLYHSFANEQETIEFTYHKGDSQDVLYVTVTPHKPNLEVINGRG